MIFNLVINDAQISLWLSTLWLPFLRIGAALMLSPVFSSTHIPSRIRIILPIFIVAVLLPTMPTGLAINALGVDGVLLAANEILVGICLGFLLQLTFESVSFASQLMATGMGLSFASLYNPDEGESVPILGQFLMLLAILLFLALDGHLAFISFIAKSFNVWPVATPVLSAPAMSIMLAAISDMLIAALHIALPALIALIMAQVAMGVVSRSAPSLNLFSIGLPVTLLLGFFVVEAMLPNFKETFQQMLTHSFLLMQSLLRARAHVG